MEEKKKCSSKKHENIDAIYYCLECKIYMCKKCESLHSDLLQNHSSFSLNKNKEEIFTGLCKEVEHFDKLYYFCKTHNQLCCGKCISKIKGKGNGQHADCEVCFIEDIKEIKKNTLKDNIKNLEAISKNIEQSLNELKKISDKIKENKENLTAKIQRIFTKLRNVLNEREDYLLLELDEIFNLVYFNDNIIRENEKLPSKIKNSLDRGKKIENHWDNDQKLNSLINDCINIENNIKEITRINENIKKYNLKSINNTEIKFHPKEDRIDNFLNIIKTFGNIYYKSGNYIDLKKNKLNINKGNDILLISSGKIQILNNLLN